MRIILNEREILIPSFISHHDLYLNNQNGSASIKGTYTEKHPLDTLRGDITKYETTLMIESKPRIQTKTISYSKPLTDKSGIGIHINLDSKDTSIESGYIDFYTIKKRGNKRNGFYRLEFINDYFKLQAITRKSNRLTNLVGYQLNTELTSITLASIITRMINIINRHAKAANKTPITNKYSSVSTVDNILLQEAEFIEIIEDVICFDLVDQETANELKAFLDSYLGRSSIERKRTNHNTEVQN